MKSIQQRIKNLVGLWALALVGCSPPATQVPTSNESTPPSSVSSTAGADKDQKATPIASDKQAVDLPSEVSPSEKAPSQSSPTTVDIERVASPQPTDEQLARWKHDSFDPLQLVAYRESDRVGFVSFMALANGGREYVLGGTRLTLWNLTSGERIHEFIDARTLEEERLLSFAVSPDGNWCVAGDASGLLRKFDIPSRKEVATASTDGKSILQLAISPDGKEVAAVSYNGEVFIRDADTLKDETRFKVDSREVNLLQYITADMLVAAGETICSWDTQSGAKLKTFPSSKYQSAVALSPDAKYLVFGADDYLQNWNLVDDRPGSQYWGVPHRNATIRFAPDGTLVAVVALDGIRILSAATGQLLQIMDAAGSSITDVCWIAQSHALMVVTETGTIRIWGRPDECRKLGVEPLPTLSIDVKTSPGEPATVAQNLAVIDLRLLPKLPDAKPQNDYFNSVNYVAPVGVEEVKTFYGHVLGQRGWTKSSALPVGDSILFEKDGCSLNVSLYANKDSETYVTLWFLGNHDIRKTPKLDAYIKEKVFEGPTSVVYKVEASLLRVETELLKAFNNAGWNNFVRLTAGNNESGDRRNLEFVKDGTILNVMIQRDPGNDKWLNVHYSQSLTLYSLPVPSDAGVMEWNDFAECQMVANTSLSLKEATAFYEAAMKQQGWTALERGRRMDEDVVYLPYYWGQRNVTVALEPLSSGWVRIKAGKYSEFSWQQPKDQADENDEPDESPDNSHQPSAEGIEAADVPILHAREAPSYDSAREEIHFELDDVPLIELSKEYQAAFTELGWTATAFGEPAPKSVGIHFNKEPLVIYYQSAIDPVGKAYLTLSGNGLLWNKTIATRQLIPYSQWLRNNKRPASLKFLDEYQTQMGPLDR